MPNYKSKFGVDDVIEFRHNEGDIENAFGKITSVKFRRVDAVNHLAEYNVQLFNSDKVVEEIRDTEIVARFSKDERERL